MNLDYFLSVNSSYDLYGRYRDFRDDDLRYILYDWQYARLCWRGLFLPPAFVDGILPSSSTSTRVIPTATASSLIGLGVCELSCSDWGYRRPRIPLTLLRIARSGEPLRRIARQLCGALRRSRLQQLLSQRPLRIVEGRYGGRGWSYDTGNTYYDGSAYSSPRQSAPAYTAPYNGGGYAPSRQYENSGMSRTRGTTYSSGGYNGGESSNYYAVLAPTMQDAAVIRPRVRIIMEVETPVIRQDVAEVLRNRRIVVELRRITTPEATRVWEAPLIVPRSAATWLIVFFRRDEWSQISP